MAGIIKVNQYQDFNGNTLFTSDGNGNLTTQNILYPAFEAYLSSDQGVSDNTVTKAQIDTELFDTDNCYDNSTNYRFTPTTAGKYFVYCTLEMDGGTGTNLNGAYAFIYKNGSNYMRNLTDFYNNQVRAQSITVSAIIDMNGSSDYLEAFGNIDVISNSTQKFQVGTKGTKFGAYRIGD